MATTQLSRSAFERLQAEFNDLTTRGRIEVANKIETARLMGDLSENGDYHAAKDEQGHMEGRIRELEHIIETAEIIEGGDAGIVSTGSIVTSCTKVTTIRWPSATSSVIWKRRSGTSTS